MALEKDQVVLTEPDWRVLVAGDHAPNELVECYRESDPTQKCAFYALFIVTGEYPQ